MSQPDLPNRIVDQLRANLRAAGISAAEADIQGIVEKGFLSRLPTIEQILEGAAADSAPDYLGGWIAPTAPSASSSSGETEQAAAIEQALLVSPAWERGGEGQLHYATLAQVAELIRARQLSPVELLAQTLDRIARRDP